MTMPQSIRVVIVAGDKERLSEIEQQLALPAKGRAPRYYFATPDDNINELVNPNNYRYAHVDLWISLDVSSYDFCQVEHATNLGDPNYDRGFYDESLPNAIIDLTGKKTIEAIKETTAKVLAAFQKSS